MHWRLGIDMGTSANSLVACEIDKNGVAQRILHVDLSVFREPVTVNAKNMVTTNSIRRTQRLRRRQIARKAARIRKIVHIARSFGVDAEQMRELKDRNVFLLRRRALTEKLSLPELFKVLLHLAKHRGYKGDLRSEGTVGTKIMETEKLLEGGKTLGELWYERQQAARKSHEAWKIVSSGQFQGTFIFRRDVEDEFRRIMKKQREYHPQLSERYEVKHESYFPDLQGRDRVTAEDVLFSAIFYQRPIKWEFEKVGACSLIPAEKRSATAQIAFQKYRLAKTLSDLRIVERSSGKTRELDPEERRLLFDYVVGAVSDYNSRNVILQSEIFKQLGLERNRYKLNFEKCGGMGVKGIATLKVFVDCGCLAAWNELSEAQGELALEFLNNITKYSDIQENSDEHIEKSIKELTANLSDGFAEEDYRKVSRFIEKLKKDEVFFKPEFKLENHRASYGLTALKKLTAELLNGKNEYDIIQEFYPCPRERAGILRPAQEVFVGNPVIDRALVQLERSVRYTIKKLGCNPAEIVVELSRDMKKSLAARLELDTKNKKTAELRVKIAKELEALGVVPSTRNIERYILYRELDKQRCPYCGETITKSDAFNGGKTEVDHIVPRGAGGANRYNNKVLCCKTCNLEKGRRTPYLWAQDPNPRIKFDEVTRKFAEKLKKSKDGSSLYEKRRILAKKGENLTTRESLEDLTDDFNARQGAQTSWLGKVVLDYLKDICDHVTPSFGALTAYARHQLGLDTLLPEIRMHEQKKLYSQAGTVIDDKMWSRLFLENTTYSYLQTEFDNPEETERQQKIAEMFKLYQNELAEKPQQPESEEKQFDKFIAALRSNPEYGYDKRCDHRHHAVDAAVICLCSLPVIQRANRFCALYGDLGRSKSREHEGFRLDGIFNGRLRSELKRRLTGYVVWHKPDHFPGGGFFDATAYNVRDDAQGVSRFVERVPVADFLNLKTTKETRLDEIEKLVVQPRTRELLKKAVQEDRTEIRLRGNPVKFVKAFYKKNALIEMKPQFDIRVETPNAAAPDKPHVKYYRNAGYACYDFDRASGKKLDLIPRRRYEKIKNNPVPDNVVRIFINDMLYNVETKKFLVVGSFKERDGLQMRETTEAVPKPKTYSFSNIKTLRRIESQADIKLLGRGACPAIES